MEFLQIQLADLWLYVLLEFSQNVYPDAMEIAPWIKEFVENFKANPKVKKYLAERPDAVV